MVDSVTWCHCSDVHLGYKQYNLSERLHDFGSAFNKCFSLILQENPDFILLTGDLFEHYNPNPPELRQAIAILNKLKKLDGDHTSIPIYVIPGNHDVSTSASKRAGGDILDFLQDLKLIHYLADSYEIVMKNEKPIALVAGLRYWGKKTSEKLNEFCELHKKELTRTDIPKILLVHAFVEGSVANYDISTYGLNIHPFDYIALGHYHMCWPEEYQDKKNKAFYPGGTEHRTSAEWGCKRGFIKVKAEQNKGNWNITPNFITYDVREKKSILHDFGTATAAQIMEITRKLIEENDKEDLILKLDLRGNLKKGEIPFLNLQGLKTLAKKVLYIDIANHITPILTDTAPIKTDKEAYIEVFKNIFNIKREQLDQYAELVKTILKIVDDRDFNETIPKILEEFIEKTPITLKEEEPTDKEREKEKIEEPPKTRKKAKGTKKLDAFTKKGVSE